jgi:hypothetical protein
MKLDLRDRAQAVVFATKVGSCVRLWPVAPPWTARAHSGYPDVGGDLGTPMPLYTEETERFPECACRGARTRKALLRTSRCCELSLKAAWSRAYADD